MRTLRSGFTLVEALLYTIFVALILTTMTLLTTAAFTARGRVRSDLILKQNVRYALTQISTSIADATGITTPAIGTSSSTLVLSMASTTQNPTTFKLTNGTITMKQGTGATFSLLSNEVSLTGFTFTRVSSTTPTVRIVANGAVRGAPANYPSMTVTTTAAVRR